MEGGLPLVDFTGGNFDLTRPREYFNSLIAIAERKMPEDAKSIVDIIKDQQFDWGKMIKASFDHVEDEPPVENRKNLEETEDNLDLIDLFVEESLRPELEYVADKYGKIVAKFGWTEGYCPICGKEPKIGEIRGQEDGKRYLFCHQCGYKWNFRRISAPSVAMKNSILWLILRWKERSGIMLMCATSAVAILKQLSSPRQLKK